LATAERALANPHPAAEGHFPGNPVIPGAVLLAETLSAVAAGLGADLAGARLRSAKFLAPARPGDRLVIEYARAAGGAVRFSCAVAGRTVLRGEVACDARSTPA
jgi:3-hydroxymyristoyl/3-hydroxydecanoyl-(acyl carrier protein) dehydratase